MTIQANQGFGVSIFGATSAGGGGSTSPGGSSGQLQYNASGSFGGMAGTSWDDTNRSLTLTGATVTTSQPVLNLSQTWNAAGVAFTGLKVNITNTASAAASLLADFQIGGTSFFNVTKNTTGINWGGLGGVLTTGFGTPVANRIGVYILGTERVRFVSSTLDFGSGGGPVWGTALGTSDLFLTRAAAATLQLGAADTSASSTVTITIATPGVVTWNGHDLTTGTPVIFSTTGALPTGITAGTTYYVIAVNANTFQIATSWANSMAGTAVTTSGSQSGTHTGTRGAIDQMLRVQSASGTTNFPGADFAIQGSRGTGTGAGGSIIFQVAPAGGSGSTQNAYATAAVLTGAGIWDINSAITSGFQINNGATLLFYANTSNVVQIGGNGLMPRTDGSQALGAAPTGGFSGGWANLYLHTNAAVRFNNDTILARDGQPNTLALRNGTNAQTFNVYNTYTDASNYERAALYWSSNSAWVEAQAAGTGTLRSLNVNGLALNLRSGGTLRWQIDTSGHFVAGADNTYDIGASGASRPRNVYVAGNVVAGGSLGLQLGNGAAPIYWSGRSQIYSPANGNVQLTNSSTNDFDRLQFGGTTSSFPALKRSSATLQVRLADDSAYAPVEASTVRTATAYTVATLPAAGTAGRKAYVTDATAPTFLGALTGGGAVVTPVFDNGTAWVAG